MARPKPIDPQIREWLRERVTAESVRTVAVSLNLADATLLRVIAGLDVQAGTDVIVQAAFRSQKKAA